MTTKANLVFRCESDTYFQGYATDMIKGKSQWFLEPIGGFCSKNNALDAFLRARTHLTEFVRDTDIDLRKHFTLRNNIENKDVSDIIVRLPAGMHRDIFVVK